MKITSDIRSRVARAGRVMSARLRTGLAVFVYMMLGMAPALADDIDIYTKNVASGGGGAPVIVFLLDNSGSMQWLVSEDNTNADNVTNHRNFLVKDAARGQVTGMPGRYKVGLFEYSGSNGGVKMADALPLSTVLSSTSAGSGSFTLGIADGTHDVVQAAAAQPVRFAEFSMFLNRYVSDPVRTATASPYNGSWTSSGGQVSNNTAEAAGNKVIWYQHLHATSTSQTFTLDATGVPLQDTWLAITDENGNLIAANDDRTPQTGTNYTCAKPPLPDTGWGSPRYSIGAGELSSPPVPRCRRTCSASEKTSGKYGCIPSHSYAYYPAASTANVNSTVALTGLVRFQWYRIVVGTKTAGKVGNFQVKLSSTGNGAMYIQSMGAVTYDQRAGLLWKDLEIPRGATVSNAYIEFTPASDSSGAANLAVGLDAALQPADFVTQDLYTRTVNWGPYVSVPAWTASSPGAATRMNVTSLLNAKVNTSGWCGGDVAFLVKSDGGSYLRDAYAFDSSTSGTEPKLVVEWTGGTTDPCYSKSVVMDVKVIGEDVSQGADGAMTFDGISIPVGNGAKAGLRFSLVPLPQGVTVQSAKLELYAHANASPQDLEISVINENIAQPFGARLEELDAREVVGEPIPWTPPAWQAGTRYVSPELKDQVQLLFDNPAWEYDGTIGLIVDSPESSQVRFRAWERHQTSDTAESTNVTNFGKMSARLYLTVTSPTPIPVQSTHRAEVVSLVMSLPATTNTPIAGSYLEVARYLLGKSGYTMPDLASGDCATNAVVLLTDGDETGSYSSSLKTNVSAISAKTGSQTTCSSSTEGTKWACTYDLMDALYAGTTLASDGEKYAVRAYSIGFGPVAASGTGYLPSSDGHGGGKYYSATNAAALVEAFREISASLVDAGGSVAAPGVAVNSLNKFEHLDELYYSLFKPSTKVSWKGNAKRYRLGSSVIQDVDRDPAIDPDTRRFAATSESWWSQMEDGSVVSIGGAAGEMTGPDQRRMYTYLGAYGTGLDVDLGPTTSAAMDGAGAEAITTPNNFLTADHIGLSSLPTYPTMTGPQITAARTQIISWLRGGTNLQPRLEFGSAIHSSPTLVNYTTAGGDAINTIFFGDNEGVLHMIDTGPKNTNVATDKVNAGGQELFSFVPKELLKNAAALNANTRTIASDGYIYGLDGNWVPWKYDINNNDVVDGADKVYIYGGMRRGGNYYFGLDVTNVRRDVAAASRNPKLKWAIGGAVAGTPYENMGQTWADPVVRQVKWNGSKRTVVFLSGGYDAAIHDGTQEFSDVNQRGRQVYMVDAVTGQLLWWTSSQTSANTVVPAMKYSVVSAPVTMDRNGNGFVDGFYVADLAGQLFRYDIDESAGGASTFIRGNAPALVARLGATAASADPIVDNRRFYDSPAVAYVSSGAGGDLMIALTSGYRERPASALTKEKAFMILDRGAWNITPAAQATITVNSLAELPASGELTSAADLAKPGWHMDFQKTLGEKGMGTPLFFNFVLLFSSYVPQGTATDIACAPDIGYSRLYVMNALTGKGAVNTAFPNVSANQRFVDQTVPGLSSAPQMLFREGNLTTLSGTFAADASVLSTALSPAQLSEFSRALWFEVGN